MQTETQKFQLEPRRATLYSRPKTAPKRKLRGLHFAVDAERSVRHGLLAKAAFGPIRRDNENTAPVDKKDAKRKIHWPQTKTRPSDSDIQVAANQAAYNDLTRVIAGSATSAMPPDWTTGYTLPLNRSDGRSEGAGPAESGWNLDPSAMALIGATYERMVTKALSGNAKAADEALKRSFQQSVQQQNQIVSEARKRRYHFHPRRDDKRTAKVALPWVTGLYYELSARSMQPMWVMVELTRIPSTESIMTLGAGIAIREQQQPITDTLQKSDMPAEEIVIKQLLDQIMPKIVERESILERLRSRSMRLVMQASNIDPDQLQLQGDQRRIVYRPPGTDRTYLNQSMFFGFQHTRVQQEIESAVENDFLRWLFMQSSQSMFGSPMFGYRLDRVLLSEQRPTSTSDALKTPVGLRIEVPPAPKGYIRGNVVILLRVAPGLQDPYSTATRGIFLVSIPDHGTFRLSTDQDSDPPRSVADLPASIILYMSEKLTDQEREELMQERSTAQEAGRSDPVSRFVNLGGIGVPPLEGITSSMEGHIGIQVPTTAVGVAGSLIWQTAYDVVNLEYLSGDGGLLHPIRNKLFRERLEQIFFCNRTSRQEGPTSLAPRVELFVELRVAPREQAISRQARRMYRQRRGVDGNDLFAISSPPTSLTAYQRFDLRFDTDKRRLRDLPLIPMRSYATVTQPTIQSDLFFQLSEEELREAELHMQEFEREGDDEEEEEEDVTGFFAESSGPLPTQAAVQQHSEGPNGDQGTGFAAENAEQEAEENEDHSTVLDTKAGTEIPGDMSDPEPIDLGFVSELEDADDNEQTLQEEEEEQDEAAAPFVVPESVENGFEQEDDSAEPENMEPLQALASLPGDVINVVPDMGESDLENDV